MTVLDNKELVEWIRGLERTGEMWRFYKGKEWTVLKEQVLKDQHYECQRCLREGRLTAADTVHHVNEVKKRPDLALTYKYKDKDGNEVINLEALCKPCHNKEHNRFYGGSIKIKKQLNEEKW